MGTGKAVDVSASDARQLAYYKSDVLDFGVVGPVGWDCFAVYGSGGSALFVVPERVDSEHILAAVQHGFEGPIIEVEVSDGDTSGRYTVAEVIGLVFPAYRKDAKGTMADIDQTLPAGPYPADQLSRKSKRVVEYVTPTGKEGLGTHSRLGKSHMPIHGVAILFGEPLSLVQLSVRLSKDQEGLAAAIISQVERDLSALGDK